MPADWRTRGDGTQQIATNRNVIGASLEWKCDGSVRYCDCSKGPISEVRIPVYVQLRKNCSVSPHKKFSKRENVDRGGGGSKGG